MPNPPVKTVKARNLSTCIGHVMVVIGARDAEGKHIPDMFSGKIEAVYRTKGGNVRITVSGIDYGVRTVYYAEDRTVPVRKD